MRKSNKLAAAGLGLLITAAAGLGQALADDGTSEGAVLTNSVEVVSNLSAKSSGEKPEKEVTGEASVPDVSGKDASTEGSSEEAGGKLSGDGAADASVTKGDAEEADSNSKSQRKDSDVNSVSTGSTGTEQAEDTKVVGDTEKTGESGSSSVSNVAGVEVKTDLKLESGKSSAASDESKKGQAAGKQSATSEDGSSKVASDEGASAEASDQQSLGLVPRSEGTAEPVVEPVTDPQGLVVTAQPVAPVQEKAVVSVDDAGASRASGSTTKVSRVTAAKPKTRPASAPVKINYITPRSLVFSGIEKAGVDIHSVNSVGSTFVAPLLAGKSDVSVNGAEKGAPGAATDHGQSMVVWFDLPAAKGPALAPGSSTKPLVGDAAAESQEVSNVIVPAKVSKAVAPVKQIYSGAVNPSITKRIVAPVKHSVVTSKMSKAHLVEGKISSQRVVSNANVQSISATQVGSSSQYSAAASVKADPVTVMVGRGNVSRPGSVAQYAAVVSGVSMVAGVAMLISAAAIRRKQEQ